MKTKYETTVYSLPSYWASYLINGDSSGIDDSDIADCDAFLASLPWGWSCVDVSGESDFRHSNDAGSLAGDCADYTFIREKSAPVIRLENPPSGAIPVTLEQLLALGFTPEEIEAGEKRLESVHSGPWSICRSIRGIVERAEFIPETGGSKSWVEFYPARKMSNPRSCGYDMEGTISLKGEKVSAFTSSQLFELPDGRLVDCGILFARS